jgi:hypothetical protein
MTLALWSAGTCHRFLLDVGSGPEQEETEGTEGQLLCSLGFLLLRKFGKVAYIIGIVCPSGIGPVFEYLIARRQGLFRRLGRRVVSA